MSFDRPTSVSGIYYAVLFTMLSLLCIFLSIFVADISGPIDMFVNLNTDTFVLNCKFCLNSEVGVYYRNKMICLHRYQIKCIEARAFVTVCATVNDYRFSHNHGYLILSRESGSLPEDSDAVSPVSVSYRQGRQFSMMCRHSDFAMFLLFFVENSTCHWICNETNIGWCFRRE